jgi:hypothetical protein
LNDAAASVTGAVVTYVPAQNNNTALVAGDRIEISYVYNVCTGGAVPTIVDGSETKVIAGTGTTVTGIGTTGNPYVINAATATDVSLRVQTGGNAITVAGAALVNYTVPVHNSVPSAWNNTTGTFTAPVAGYYNVTGRIAQAATWAVAQYLQLAVQKNGGTTAVFQNRAQAAGAYTMFAQGSTVVFLAAGDTLRFVHSSSVATNLVTNTFLNEISITKI